MKSCKLYVRNEGHHNESFEVAVSESVAVDSTVKTTQVDLYSSKDIRQIEKFLNKYEVSQSDLKEALTCMDVNGHNVANFGWMGGFVFSSHLYGL